ncbi:MAG: hypothetical protein Pg6A_02130 [Termitinemataceae bacterium]|nr:MAG: hypothetical protein Pg6A_02130 [Termitinemataceae bacterium]
MENYFENDFDIQVDDYRVFCDDGWLEYSLDDDSAVIMAIDVSCPGIGIGTALVREFERMALAENCITVSVPVSLTSGAISFWSKIGYKPVSDEDEQRMDEIINSDDFDPDDDSQGVIEFEKILV